MDDPMPGRGAMTTPGGQTRPAWRAGDGLTAGALCLEQRHRFQRLRRHRRLIHGWGVVCGLNIVAANHGQPGDLTICPGYGLGPCGDEILLQAPLRFNLGDYLWSRPIDARSDRVWVGVEAGEEPSAYARAPSPKCGCACGCGEAGQVSRLIDIVRVVVSWAPPLPASGFDICGGGAPPYPECPDSCALPLGSVATPWDLLRAKTRRQ